MNEQKKISLIDYLETIVKWRKYIVRNVLVILVVTLIICFLVPNVYTATTTILPPSTEQNALMGLMAGGLASGLANISGLSAVLPGLATPSDLYAAIMRSGNIKGKIISKYDLKKVFKSRTMTDCSKVLDKMTDIRVSPEGIVSVNVTYVNKQLAANIANSYVEELDRFNTQTAMTVGKRYRIFIEQRLKETTDTLAKAEQTLRDFQELHKTVAFNIEIENAITTVAKIKSEIILREVQRGAMVTGGSTINPYVQNIDQELRELRKQLAKIEFGSNDTTKKEYGAGFSIPFEQLPAVSLEYARLLRDVKVQEAIYELLTQQYEQAKIMEVKDTPTVQILDRASPPEKKSFPKRSVILFLVFIASIALSVLIVFAIEYVNIEREKERSNINRLLYMSQYLAKDFLKLKMLLKKWTVRH